MSKKITQFSTIGALMAGHHCGEFHIPLGTPGFTFGLGCSDLVNAEVTIRRGVAYTASAAQPVGRLTATDVTPFIQVTDFNPDATVREQGLTMENLPEAFRKHVPHPDNTFYAIQIHAAFDSITVRRPQVVAPGTTRTMLELAKEQEVDAREGIKGYVVGLWTPTVFGRVSVPGFHLHFVDESEKVSGHVLQFKAATAELAYEEKSSIEIMTPTSEAYRKSVVDLGSLDGTIHKVEK